MAVDHHNFDEQENVYFRNQLVQWYEKCKRDLPWREAALKTQDPNERAYAVWVSEIMLQQTQVATVIDYYNRWMKRWPTVHKLSQATLEEVNEMWSGLGYYSRGRRLYEGSCKVVGQFEGNIPQNAKELMKELPGVGRYTASAIASICFEEAIGVVDGNVVRVLSRMRLIGSDSSNQSTMDLFWDVANKIVDTKKPGDFNQAIMELGATVCTPKSPSCNSCPVSKICKAYARSVVGSTKIQQTLPNHKDESIKQYFEISDIEDIPSCQFCLPEDSPWDKSLGVMNYPRKAKKKAAKDEIFLVAVIERKLPTNPNKSKSEYLIVQRPDSGLLAKMWEFPSTLAVGTTSDNEVKHQLFEYLEETFGAHGRLSLEGYKFIGEVKHVFSHLHHTYKVAKVEMSELATDTFDGVKLGKNIQWVTREMLYKSAISTAVKKIFHLYEQHVDGRSNKAVKQGQKRKQPELIQVPGQVKIDNFFSKKQCKK